MYRDLLVHVDGSDHARLRARLAVDLAQRSEAHLAGLHITPPVEIPPHYKPSKVEAAVADASRILALDAEAAETTFRDEALARLPDARWSALNCDIVQGVSERARYADLVILGQYEWQGPPEVHPLPVSASIVLKCGRPVLVVPAGVQSCSYQRIAVAWDGSREAVRAVHDALPLLRMAQKVHVLTITPSSGPGETDAERVVEHLKNHGASVEANVERVRFGDENSLLQRRIDEGEYDLLVMGAYSHPIWLEFAFGGATHRNLISSRIPVLVSH